MLSIDGRATMLCDRFPRRQWLRIAGISLGGLSLEGLLAGRNAVVQGGPTSRELGKAKNCIVLFMAGGPPQHETWDPKPEANT